MTLIGGRARKTQEYPEKLCEKIIEGIQRQMEADKWGIAKVKVMKFGENLQAPKHDEDMNETGENNENMVAWDDITGAELNVEDIKKARRDEITYFKRRKVYTKIPRSALPNGEKVIRVRWVDINKVLVQSVLMSNTTSATFNVKDRIRKSD